MWSPVTPLDSEEAAPSARSKHSATLWAGNVYLLGGRNGNVPLKDFWKYNLADGKWQQLKSSGDRPPCLQEHTAVAHRECIYVFGGELGFSAGTETPLWVYDITKNVWRKVRTQKGVHVPRGRRGHTALVHKGHMLVYGGYQDLRGSCSELWAFHFETETWHLLSGNTPGGKNANGSNETIPPARHKHSAVLYDDAMWVYGGMSDLKELSDLWKWDTRLKTWTTFKLKNAPGPLHSHAACRLPSSMIIFGGERDGHSTNDLWKFSFDTETWEKIILDGNKPHPRAECVAFAVSELLLKGTNPQGSQQENRNARTRLRTSSSADGKSRHSSYLPQNRVSPYEKTYVFQPSGTNYTDGSDQNNGQKITEDSKTATNGFLREISKLSQLNLSRLQNKCNYTVLTTGNNDSTESLLRQHATTIETSETNDHIATPTRMVKSKSAYAFKNKRFNGDDISPDRLTAASRRNNEENKRMTHEPISVPNFSTLTLPTPVLTPVEAARLVFLDSDEERDYRGEPREGESPRDVTVIVASREQIYDNFVPVKRDESYISHLGYADNPLYQQVDTTCVAVKFNDCPKVEEISDENHSTSDYASIETVSHVSSKNGRPVSGNRHPEERCNANLFRAKDNGDGPFGFCNPNYLGPDIKVLLTNETTTAWCDDNDGRKQYAKILNTPDSVLEDNMGRSTSRHMFLEENVEMQNMSNSELSKSHSRNTIKSAQVDTTIQHSCLKQRTCKSRASSASRADHKGLRRVHVAETAEVHHMSDAFVPLYVFVIGGKEHGQVTVFKRPVSIWKLKLF